MATIDLTNPFVDDEVRPRAEVIRRRTSGHPCINWTFTLNNYRQEDFEHLEVLYSHGHFKYLIYGKEICPTTGTIHLQGFLQLKKKCRFNGIKKLLGDKYHLEEAQYPWHAAEYCKKDGEFNEFGKFVTQVTLVYE